MIRVRRCRCRTGWRCSIRAVSSRWIAPQQLYTQPRTAFVADFVGGANVLPAALAETLTGRAQACAIRPEQIYFLSEQGAGLQLPGQVLDIQYHGAASRFEVEVAGGRRLVVAVQNGQALSQYRPEPGSAVHLGLGARGHGLAERAGLGHGKRKSDLGLAYAIWRAGVCSCPRCFTGAAPSRSSCCWRRRCCGSASSTSARYWRCSHRPSYTFDDFTMAVSPVLTLDNFRAIADPSNPLFGANIDIVLRTLGMASAVTLASALLAFPIAYYMARYVHGRWKGASGISRSCCPCGPAISSRPIPGR